MNKSVSHNSNRTNSLLRNCILFLLVGLLAGCGGGSSGGSNDGSDSDDVTADGNASVGNTDGSGNSSNTDGDTSSGQEKIIINEASSSNATFEDSDGDSPDWFELYNGQATAVDLSGWSITDDILEPQKWAFPAIELAAGAYLRVWASDKDRSTTGIYKTLVNRGDNFRYLLPTDRKSVV
jgi:hypothetical protein